MSAWNQIEQQLNRFVSARFQARWDDVKEGLWFLPACGTLTCAAMALLLVKLDSTLTLSNRFTSSSLFFGAGVEGARGVLSAIAASIVTVTGTIFSIVIVALQLASSQFTPRVMRHFTGDRINQAVLAVMIGTFTYCMLVLRSVRAADDVGGAFVPVISVTVAIALSLVCISGLIWFIHHSARQLQVPFILERAANDTKRLVAHAFPTTEGTGEVARPPAEPFVEVLAPRSGYIQDIDLEHLVDVCRDCALRIQVLQPCGAWVLVGAPLIRVWPDDGDATEHDLRTVADNVVLGIERTLQHDVAFGFRQIADIAVKAISAAINDPTTATQTIDQLNDLLVWVGNRPAAATVVEVDGRPAIFLEAVSFALLVDTAYTQIRHYGAGDLVVMAHLIEGSRQVAALVPERHRAVLATHARMALETALKQDLLDEEKDALRAVGAWAERHSIRSTSEAIDRDVLIAI